MSVSDAPSEQFGQKMSACTLTNESFSDKRPGDAYLDDYFKCRTCGKFAGEHPAPLTQGKNHINSSC
jgi:hypothetical protein